MHYDFPIIKRIEDVLPAIEGRDEFIVAEREGYTVINYNVGFEDTFTIDENDLMMNYGDMIPKGVMRRECRGIIFDANGYIISRPFHKFFNVGERDETQLHNVDLSQDHTVMEKMDGSMIRPLVFFDKDNVQVLALGTKMGITDTANQAQEYLNSLDLGDRYGKQYFMLNMANRGFTPLFEFVAPDNRIVIEYDSADLVLLAVRDNVTGEYMSYNDMVRESRDAKLSVVPQFGAVDGDFGEYIDRQRGKEGREGDIIRFADGHMLKIKNDWYVRIHKVKDKIRSDRHILSLVLNNELDDIFPHLDENDFNRVKKFERDFHVSYKEKLVDLSSKIDAVLNEAGGDKKKLAVEVLPNSSFSKKDYSFAFKAYDGHDVGELLMKHILSNLGNTVKYNELAKFLGLNEDVGEVE